MRDLDGAILPSDAPIHITVSWAVGALMSFLADTYRRQMFVNHKLAATAAEKELRETQVRVWHFLVSSKLADNAAGDVASTCLLLFLGRD